MDQPLTPTGRAFAAIVPPPEAVAELTHHLDGVPLPGRPVPPPNWHVTLRFAGQVDAVTYERWLAALDEALLPEPFTATVAGFGAFPKARRATVLWLGVRGEGLAELAASVDEAAAQAGLGNEERPFRGHLTLARLRPPADVTGLTGDEPDWRVRFPVSAIHVMAAVGSRYRIYETFDL